MSTVGAIQAGGGAATTARAEQRRDAMSTLTSDEFLQLIFTELGKQDPLQPSDTNALIKQIADIRSIQSDLDMATRLQTLVGQNEMAQASGLIGRRVEGLSAGNERLEGVVRSVVRTKDGAVLDLGAAGRLSMAALERVLGDEAGTNANKGAAAGAS